MVAEKRVEIRTSSDGNRFYVEHRFAQDHQGSSYGKTYVAAGATHVDMACANVGK